MNSKITFLGAGKMATALAGGLSKNLPRALILAYDISAKAAESFRAATGIRTTNSLDEAVDFADAVVLAVKPQNSAALFDSMGGRASSKLIVSIMAGVRISAIERKTASSRIVRVMPNTPALVGKGVSAYAVSEAVSGGDIEIAQGMLESVGSSLQVDEAMMDAVTALSGSGPAYVFEFIEALARAGEAAGLPYEMALKLSADTVEGAAVLLKRSSTPPDSLRDNVTSPGGTTAKALEVLSRNHFRETIRSAIIAAKDRSIELGSDK